MLLQLRKHWTRKPHTEVQLDPRHWLFPFLRLAVIPGAGIYRNLKHGDLEFDVSANALNEINETHVRRYDGTTSTIDRGSLAQDVSVGAGFIARISPNSTVDGSAVKVGITFNSLTLGVDHTTTNPWQWATHIRTSGGWQGVKYGTPPPAGKLATVAGIWDDSAQQVHSYQDGRLQNSSATGLGTYDTSGRSAFTIGCGVDVGGANAYYTDMDMEFLLYFEGIVPTDMQIASLTENIYQILQPAKLHYGIPAEIVNAVTLSDNMPLTDSPAVARDLLRQMLDNMLVTDALSIETVTQAVVRVLTSAMALSDTIGIAKERAHTLASALDIRDLVDLQRFTVRGVSDELKILDDLIVTLQGQVINAILLSEGIDVVDLLLGQRFKDIGITDAADITDSLIAELQGRIITALLSDGLPVADLQTVSRGFVRALLANIAIADALAHDSIVFRMLADNATVSDELLAELIRQLHVITLTDNMDITDSLARTLVQVLAQWGIIKTSLASEPVQTSIQRMSIDTGIEQ